MSTFDMGAVHRLIIAEQRAERIELSPMAPLVRENYCYLHIDRDPQRAPTLTLYGMPVRIDPSMPTDQIKLIAADGSTIRIVNIGE